MGWGHLSSLTAAPSGAHLRPPSPLGFYDMHGAQAAPCHSCWAMVRSGVAVTFCEVAVQHDAEKCVGHRKDLKGQGGWHSGRCLLPGFLGLLLEVLGHKLHLLLLKCLQ